jgi:hypothetical protein
MTPPPPTNRALYRRCLDGSEPAESLSMEWRERLLRILHNRGWTDCEIAVHTRMSTYTTARIRSRMRLKPNTAWKGVA